MSTDATTTATATDTGTQQAAATQATTTTTAATQAATTATPGNFREFLGDDGRFKPGWTKPYGVPDSLEKKFTSPEALVKSYAQLERFNGNQNKISIPNENSPKEDWDSYYKSLGRPETADKYEIAKPEKIPDALWQPDRVNGFKAKAHELGLSSKQAAELAAWHADLSVKDMASFASNSEVVKTQAVDSLKTEWGTRFDANVKAAQAGAKALGGDELLNHPALGNDPTFIKAMAKYGASIAESGAPGLRQGGPMAGNPRQEAQKIMADKNDPYWKAGHPAHANRVLEVQSLLKEANGEG